MLEFSIRSGCTSNRTRTRALSVCGSTSSETSVTVPIWMPKNSTAEPRVRPRMLLSKYEMNACRVV